MKILFFLLLLCTVSSAIMGQSQEPKFGELMSSDLSLTNHKKFPDAEAIVLFDLGKSDFIQTDNGFDIRFRRHRRVKILKSSGTEHSNFEIPFYNSSLQKMELVTDIKVLTFNVVNSKVEKTPLNKKQIFTERINKNWQVMKFAAPNVKEGSIIDIYYQLETPFIFNLPDWEFQNSIPTILSQYKVRMIPFYSYVFIAKGLSKFDIYSSNKIWQTTRRFATIEFNDLEYTYGMKDIPEFKDESFIATRDDYIMKIDFQLEKIIRPDGLPQKIMSTWAVLSKEFSKNLYFGKVIKKVKSKASKILPSDLNLNGKTDMEKCQLITEFVKHNFSWDGRSSKFASKNLKSLLQQKEGNSADINLLLIGLLKAANIDVSPVVMSTRSHGKIYSKYPFDHFLNYVIAAVEIDNKKVLIDATEKQLVHYMLPPRCLNEKGLIVNEEKEEWIKLENKAPSNTSYQVIIDKIQPEKNEANLQLTQVSTGLEALKYRKKYTDSTDVADSYSEIFSEIEKTKLVNQYRYKQPFIISNQGKLQIECIKDKIIINPFIHLFSSKSPFTQRQRTYPIDFTYQQHRKYKSTIEIPEGYELLNKPKDTSWKNDAIILKATSSIDNNKLTISVQYSFRKNRYPATTYNSIKFYWNNIIKMLNEQIVLKKKQPAQAKL